MGCRLRLKLGVQMYWKGTLSTVALPHATGWERGCPVPVQVLGLQGRDLGSAGALRDALQPCTSREQGDVVG